VTGQPQAILLHPDTLRLVQGQDDDTLIGYVRRRTFRGDSYRLDIAYRDDLTLTLNIPSYDNLVPQVGDQVYMAISPDSAIPLLGEHEQE
jgi:hypothetical protein